MELNSGEGVTTTNPGEGVTTTNPGEGVTTTSPDEGVTTTSPDRGSTTTATSISSLQRFYCATLKNASFTEIFNLEQICLYATKIFDDKV